MRIIVIDENYRQHGLGSQFLQLCEQWLKRQGIKSLHNEARPNVVSFYRRNSSIEMPFEDPSGEPPSIHNNARLDNNRAERAIRPLAIGRKNWLFFGSPEGGQAGATLFSIVQTCRGLGINPREYLEDIFGRFLNHPAQQLHQHLA